MKRVMCTLIIIGLLAVGCVKRAPAPGVTDTEILIGNVQDLSGPMKELGAVIPSGSNMYFKYINGVGLPAAKVKQKQLKAVLSH